MNDDKGAKPRPKDKVRVTFDADFLADDMGTVMVDVADGMGPVHIVLPAWATVEVLERADDPSSDLIGTVRGMGETRQPWAKRNENVWVCITHDETTDDNEMSDCPITGSVPGTPAAEADKRPSQVPGPRCNATEGATGITCGLPRLHGVDVDHEGTHEPDGEHDGVGYRLFVRWPWNQWDRDAAAVGFEMPLPDWEREILVQDAARQRGPRVFSSDGPEPPEDVKALEWVHDTSDMVDRYFKRVPGRPELWFWADKADDEPTANSMFHEWPLPIWLADGTFREVLP